MKIEVLTPTWAQQVVDEHRELRQKTTELRQFLTMVRPKTGDTGAHTWAAELSQRLIRLHDELFRHFRFEDEGGMVEDIASCHPRGIDAAERLAGEHSELLAEVRRLMNDTLTYSEGRRPADTSLRQRSNEFLDRLTEHERAETEMIQCLEWEDLGVGD